MKIDDMQRRPMGFIRGHLRRLISPTARAVLPLLGAALAGAALAQGASSEGAVGAAPPSAGSTRGADNARAIERCEASVAETLRKLRGKDADDVLFTPALRSVAPGDESDVGVKGGGRYRGRAGAGASFTYGCTYNFKSGLASAVVLRETPGGGPAARRDWQPDLSRVSPEACESAVAQLLTSKHPRVARIAMEPDTRRLQPGPDEHLLLLGQGAVQRAPGMNAEPFNYSCEFNPRSGQVLAVRTSV
ncbi:MAG: hypothetical protein JNL85_17535 [Rubrivivax sp.]|nr:hypothetical protein [Rubrivivax sp.]